MISARWTEWNEKAIEDIVVLEEHFGIRAESVIRGNNFTVQYKIVLSPDWNFHRAEIQSENKRLYLMFEKGEWSGEGGKILEHLRGAETIDFVLTPFTNTLAVKKLNLKKGQSADIVTAWIDFPSLEIKKDPQRYTCLEPGKLYRFESLDSDFTADITFDADGLVSHYPQLFRRN